jgi:hypothetical protein
MKIADLTGMRSGHLIVVCDAGSDDGGRRLWSCKCRCGKSRTLRSRNLLAGNHKTCGMCSVDQSPAMLLRMFRGQAGADPMDTAQIAARIHSPEHEVVIALEAARKAECQQAEHAA